MKVSIFGIGYVGAVSAACLADSGHEVIAYDPIQVKVDCINEGRSPIIEKDLNETIQKTVANGTLKATNSIKEAVEQSDVSLICVGTPSREDGSLDLGYVKQCCKEIGETIKNKDSYHTVVLRSTMVPGSAMDIALPIIEEASGKKAGVDFGFGNNPEFLRESTAIYDYYNPPKIVIGAIDEKSGQIMSDLYKGIEAPEIITDIGVAEGVKYADNAWHAMKIGFANEIGNIFKDCGIDSHRVMDIFCMDTKLNISRAYLMPGFAFGGSCLPKDVRAIRSVAATKSLNTPIFDALMTANDEQIKRAYKMIKDSGKTKVGMLGLAFKSGTDDLRESPLVILADMLLADGIELKIYDKNVFAASQMDGANRHYIENGIPHISKNLVENASEVTDYAELFVVGNGDKEFVEILKNVANDDTPIIDLVRIGKELESRSGYKGICW